MGLGFTLFYCFFWHVFFSYSQHTIKGKITSSDDGSPLPGASILEKGTSNGVTTDFDGNYEIIVSNDSAILTFSYIGYVTSEVSVSGQSSINVSMLVDTATLDEVVVIGYGSVKKKDLTGSVKVVSSEEIVQQPVSQLGQALSGRSSGVSVQQNSGTPGEAPTIRIRGGNSINGDSSPLFVIDGFISAQGAQDIAPEDIKSIQILKDASATAIYGSRGANGVVLITTKGGSFSKKLGVEFRSFTGFQNIINKYDMLNAEQHLQYLEDFAEYRQIPPLVDDPSAIEVNTDWQEAMLRTAPIQSHYVALSGGSENIAASTSLGYLSQKGIVINSGFERITSRSKIDFTLNDNIKSGVNFFLIKSKRNIVGRVFKDVLDLSPTFPIFDEDGNYNYELSYENPGIPVANPIEILKEYTNFEDSRILGLQGYIDLKLVKDVYFKSEASYNWSHSKRNRFIPSTTLSGQQNLSTAAIISNQQQTIETVNTIRLNKSLNDNDNVNLVLGVNTITEKNERFSAEAKDIVSDELLFYNLQAGDPTLSSVASDYQELNQLSFLGRVNYSLNDKYLFTLSGRYDGSSNFGEENRFAFFPSGALAWRLSEEEFLKNSKVIDNVKLRVSYGKTGNQAIQPYQTLSLLSPEVFPFNNNQSLSFSPDNIANPGLKWETTDQFDAGLDISLLDRRLNLTFDVYYKKTNDLLLASAIPSTTGFNTFIDNIGSIENKGFEFEADGLLFDKPNFEWNINLNLSINRNEVLDLGDDAFLFPNDAAVTNALTDRTNILSVGHPIGTFYTYIFDGIYQTQDEIDNSPSVPGSRPGAPIVRDFNGDGIISEQDKTITGNSQPDFIFGLANDFIIFKNFEISMLWQGAIGGKILNYDRYLFTLNSSNVPKELFNYWTPENTNSTIINPGASSLVTDDYIEDGSYARLKNITLTYNFPKSFLESIGVKSANIFITGADLVTITNYSGINPEVNFFGDSNSISGADFNSYPSTKSVSLGINLKL